MRDCSYEVFTMTADHTEDEHDDADSDNRVTVVIVIWIMLNVVLIVRRVVMKEIGVAFIRMLSMMTVVLAKWPTNVINEQYVEKNDQDVYDVVKEDGTVEECLR